jgi:ribosomal-protein-alanine N-acetyltransferase
MKTITKFSVDWLVRCDLPEILAIEEASFGDPWTKDEFIQVLSQSNRKGHTAHRDDGTVIGFCIYEFSKVDLTILNLAVHPDFRRLGVATQLMARIGKKMKVERPHLHVDVSERNLVGHLFLRSLGFKAVKVLREHYDDGADAYRFQFTRRNC